MTDSQRPQGLRARLSTGRIVLAPGVFDPDGVRELQNRRVEITYGPVRRCVRFNSSCTDIFCARISAFRPHSRFASTSCRPV